MTGRKWLCGVAVWAAVLLWLAICAGTALAEIDLGGKLETNLVTQISPDTGVTSDWLHHLNLELLLPVETNLSARVEFDLYSQGARQSNPVPFTAELSKLYVKQRFEQFHLTVGRQPISWSFGSLLNPMDYTVTPLTGRTLDPAGASRSYDGIVGYIPLGRVSDLTMAASLSESAHMPKLAVRAGTGIGGFAVGFQGIRDVSMVPVVTADGVDWAERYTVRLAGTVKGDLGPLGVYGAAGYVLNEAEFSGKMIGMAGLDAGVSLSNEAQLSAQMEYIYDPSEIMQSAAAGPHLLAGTLHYAADEFSGIRLAVMVNPTDGSFLLAPMYRNQISDALEWTVSGAYFGGEANTQFGPSQFQGITAPRTMLQMGLGYTF